MTRSYDDYSLQKLEEWVGDVMSCDVSPEQIYDTIVRVVRESVEYHTEKLTRSTELLNLLNGKKEEQQTSQAFTCYSDDQSSECQKAWNDFWNEHSAFIHKDTIQDKKYVAQYSEEELNEMCNQSASEEEKELCKEYNVRETEFISEHLAQIEEGLLKSGYIKTNEGKSHFRTMNHDEATAAGWTLSDDGIWIPPQDKNDKVNKWVLPVETSDIDGVEDYFISLPDDLLRIVDWEEGDALEWIPNDDGSYTLRKHEHER